MDLSKVVLGIDFGDTLEYKDEFEVITPFPGALLTIQSLISDCKDVHIISKVNPDQLFNAVNWIHSFKFIEKTGFKIENLHFTPDRISKAKVAKWVGLTHMIDDNPEVTYHMQQIGVKTLLFSGPKNKYMSQWKQEPNRLVSSWQEIQDYFYS